jgi:hypothetical protein
MEPELARNPAPEGSDRSFGLVFAAVFAIVGCWPLLHLQAPRWWACGVAIAFAATAWLRSEILHHFNQAWLALGRLLHQLISPLIMGAIFFVCVTPIAWIMRLLRRDVLSLSRRPDLASYWIPREQSPPTAETMKRQF